MTQPGTAQAGATAALEKELAAARSLLETQRRVLDGLRAAAPGDRVLALVREQEEAVAVAARATLERRRHIDGPGGLAELLERTPAAERERVRELAREAARLRGELARSAALATYVASRGSEWTRAQLDLLVRLAVGPGPTYGGPGETGRERRAPSFVERSA